MLTLFCKFTPSGHIYTESSDASREGRVRDAATIMGVTVLAGGITTLGSSAFMFACQVRRTIISMCT